MPSPSEQGDKKERGTVLVVGGSAEMPGPALLAGTATLRAGAGRLRLAVPASIAVAVGVAVPEARVFPLPEAPSGALGRDAARVLIDRANEVDAVLFGPGLVDEERTAEVIADVLPELKRAAVCLDAAALSVLKQKPETVRPLSGRLIATPHLGEMAGICGRQKEEVEDRPLELAREFAARWGVVLVQKGAETHLAAPDGRAFRNCAGNVGLATGGSGDTLGGIIAGLAARGVEPLQAAAWGIYLHAAAGDRLAARIGPLGFLARELLPEIPSLLAELSR